MAVLQGISGIQLGDGAGGKVALSIDTRVLRILHTSSFSYLSATVQNPREVESGTVTYYRPEIIQAQDYGTGTTPADIPQVGVVSINIDTRRTAKYEIETFDLTRLNDSGAIVGMVSTGLALAILNDLNSNFLVFIVDKLTTDTEMKKQNVLLADLADETGTLTPEKSRTMINVLQMKIAKLSKMYNKRTLGIEKAELLTITDSIGDINIRNAFWGITGGKEMVLAKDLVAVQIGNFKYTIDNMLNNSIPAGSSFSKDKALTTTNFAGLILHNEAVGMPINYQGISQVIDPISANPRWIAKYQFGVGFVRPELVYGLVKALPTK